MYGICQINGTKGAVIGEWSLSVFTNGFLLLLLLGNAHVSNCLGEWVPEGCDTQYIAQSKLKHAL